MTTSEAFKAVAAISKITTLGGGHRATYRATINGTDDECCVTVWRRVYSLGTTGIVISLYNKAAVEDFLKQHSERPALFAAYSPAPINDRTNGYSGGNQDSR